MSETSQATEKGEDGENEVNNYFFNFDKIYKGECIKISSWRSVSSYQSFCYLSKKQKTKCQMK